MSTYEPWAETSDGGYEFPLWTPDPDTVQRLAETPSELHHACDIWEWEADCYRLWPEETDLALGLREGYHQITRRIHFENSPVWIVESGREKEQALEYFHGLTHSLIFAGDLVGIQIPSLGHFLASIVTDLFETFNFESTPGTLLRQTSELRPSVAPAWVAAHFDIRRLQFFAQHANHCADNPKDLSGRPRHPKNPDVRDLCALLAAMKEGESENSIALNFVGENVPGARKKSGNLLRQARLFPHLYKPSPKT